MNRETAKQKITEGLDFCQHGDYTSGIETFKQVVANCPEHIDAYYCLAKIETDIFKNYDSAIVYLKKGINVAPFFEGYKALAENYLLKADLPNALKYLKSALIYDSTSSDCLLYLNRYFPKEKNYINTNTVQISNICTDSASCKQLKYQKIYDGGIIKRKPPLYIESLLTKHQKLMLNTSINNMLQMEYSDGFLAKIPDGRVYLKQSEEPAVLTKDNIFLADMLNYPYKNFTPAANSINVANNLLLLSTCYSGNFYHWLTWVVPKLYMTDKAGYDFKYFDKIAINYQGFKFQKELLTLLNIPIGKIIGTIPNGVVLNAKQLIATSTPNFKITPPIVIESLRNKFLKPEVYNKNYPAKIYLSRNKSPQRHILNEEELTSFLEKEDFTTIYAENLTFSEQVKMFANAEFVISQHGAGLVNLAFCQPQTKVIEIHNEYEWWKQSLTKNGTYTQNKMSDNSFMRIACDNNLKYHIMYGDVKGNDMFADMEKFKATYDMALTS